MNNSVENVKKIKESILNTAYVLFSEKGYTKTNINEIATLCGISRTPIYYHFNNKENLHKLALEKLLKNCDISINKVLYDNSPIRDRLIKIFNLILDNNKCLYFWQQDIITSAPKESFDVYVDFLKKQAEKIKTAIELYRSSLPERGDTLIDSDKIIHLLVLLFNGLLLTTENNVFDFKMEDYESVLKTFIKTIES